MGKGDVIGWAAILGGITLVGYLGYRGISSLFSGGSFSPSGILGIGGEAGKTDVFGNTTTAYIDRQLGKAETDAAESNARLAASQAQMDTYNYGPALENAYADYARETKEYNDLLIGFKPTYGFWTGKEDPETQAYRRQLEKERAEAVVAGEIYGNIRAEWMARNA